MVYFVILKLISNYLVKFNIFHVQFVIVEEPDVGCLKRGIPAGWLKYMPTPLAKR